MTELYGQRVQTTVQTKYLPFVVDTILNSNVLFQRIVRGSKKWSGRPLRVRTGSGLERLGHLVWHLPADQRPVHHGQLSRQF